MPKISHHRCFVIMPFSKTSKEHTKEYWTKHFESFLKPLIEANSELKAYRSEPLRGDVLRQIITELVVSPLIVADLTDKNPNVFWELGVRQSFRHGTVTIAEERTQIPFDISVKAILFYSPKDHIKNAKFMKQFKKAIEDCLSRPDTPDSHVLETISGRGTLYEIIRRHEAARRVEALIEELEQNSRTLGILYTEALKENRMVTVHLRSCSLELLLTHRYLEEDSSFYELATNWHTWITAANNQIEAWNIDEKGGH